MPYYRCIIPKDSLTFEQRQDIALAFTDIHCGNTGAPRSFVSVAFFETPEGEESEFGTAYYLDGGNRAGRPEEVKQQLLADLTQAFSDISGVPVENIPGRIRENPGLVDHGGRLCAARARAGRARMVRRGRCSRRLNLKPTLAGSPGRVV